ncbi:hypothetical protein VOLCADRAFT_87516 [Volvox carteri f. nagariensis]|uniref:Uncharacterized protein n=1 Tax=Volvox carteri f. nagariensis TaxID=3068 RepID=D8TLI3_VOLCA|nr:uncharacterized protein VOLCADRAFT_87516 [Volvox carteri f. nagariensis]EFJ51878.1 hypothetical protein VOLCADRAFT_87516 [Volvox carteri f. nagariensis]|eukprot:XP_002947288.1 hypothetical protein VOLCADRAFT_87516 [Volvox carteri f. nagariensis]
MTRMLAPSPSLSPAPAPSSSPSTAGIAGFTAHADDNTIRQSVSQFDSQSQLQLPQQQERTRGSFLLQPNTLVSSSVASSAATSAVVVTIGTNVPSAGVNYGLQSQQPPPLPSRASLAAALAHTGDGSLSAASWLQPPPPVTPPPPSRNSVRYSSAGGGATGGTAAVAAAAGGGGDDLYSFEATEGIAGFTAHADDNTIRQSVSQFDSQSQLQLPQQQERTRGSFLLQPNTLVSSSVASSAATSAVVVTIGTNVPSAGVNYGLQSQQPPPLPSRASLAAALAHTGDGSLSAASWLQPPPPVTPPPPSRNSVPQQQRAEQQQMLTQQLSESYGSESTVSTLQNMYGGSTGLRPQLQAGTWGQERSMPTPTPPPTTTQQQRQAEGGGGSRLNDVRGVLRDGKDGIGAGCRDVREAEPERVSLSPGLRLRLRQDLGAETAAAAEARGGGGEGSEKGITLGGGDRGDGDDEDDGGSGGAEEEVEPSAEAPAAAAAAAATASAAATAPTTPASAFRSGNQSGKSLGGAGKGNKFREKYGTKAAAMGLCTAPDRSSRPAQTAPATLRAQMRAAAVLAAAAAATPALACCQPSSREARVASAATALRRRDFGSYGSGGGGGGCLASGGSLSEGLFASGMIVLGGSGDSAEMSKLPPVSEIPMPYSMLGTYGSGVGSMRGRLVCPVVEEDGKGEGEEAGDVPPPPPPPLASQQQRHQTTPQQTRSGSGGGGGGAAANVTVPQFGSPPFSMWSGAAVSTLSASSQTSPPAPPTTPVQLSPPTDAAAEGVTASGDVRDGCGVNRVPQRPSDIAEPPPPPSGRAPVGAAVMAAAARPTNQLPYTPVRRRLKLHPVGLSKALRTQQTVAAGTGIEGGAETLEVNSGAPVGRTADRRMGRAAAAAAAGAEAALPRPEFTFGEPRSLCSRRRSSMAVVVAAGAGSDTSNATATAPPAVHVQYDNFPGFVTAGRLKTRCMFLRNARCTIAHGQSTIVTSRFKRMIMTEAPPLVH